MTTIFVADTWSGEPSLLPREVLSKPGATYLRIDARLFGLDRDAYFVPALGWEVWPKNKGSGRHARRLYAFATRQEFDDRLERRERCKALLDAARASIDGTKMLPLPQLRQACAILGLTYKPAE